MKWNAKQIAVILAVSALFTGFIHVLPDLYARREMGDASRILFPFQSADEEHYDVNVKQALEGRPRWKNAYLYEYRTQTKSGSFFLKNERLLGRIGRVFGFEIGGYVLFMRFFFPALAFLLFYALFRSLKLSQPASLFWSALNLLAPYLLYGWFEPVARPFYLVLADRGFQFLWYEQYHVATLPWARTVNPQFSGLFFLGGMIALVRLLWGRKRVLWFSLTAVLAYVNFRMYFYFWSSLGAALVLCFFASLIWKNKKALIPFGALLTGGLIIGLPLALRLIGSKTAYPTSHAPLFSPGSLVAALLLVVGIIVIHKKRPEPAISVMMAVAPILCLVTMNQNVVTGKIVQPWHYELFTTPIFLSVALALILKETDALKEAIAKLRAFYQKSAAREAFIELLPAPLFFLSGVVLFFYYFKLAPHYKDAVRVVAFAGLELLLIFVAIRALLMSLRRDGPLSSPKPGLFWGLMFAALIIGNGLTTQAFVSVKTARRGRDIAYLAEPFRWINENAPDDAVFLASFDVSERIPLFTPNPVYLCKNAFHEHAGSEAEERERALHYFALAGYDVERFRKKLSVWPYGFLFWGLRHKENERDLYSFGRGDPVSDYETDALLEDFREMKSRDLPDLLNRFRVDYVFYGPEERKFFPSPPDDFLPVTPVFSGDEVTIYKIMQ